MSRYRHTSDLAAPVAEVFAWHMRPGAFEALQPPFPRVDALSGLDTPMSEGHQIRFRIRLGPIGILWVAEHRRIRPHWRFEDIQIRGPFARWRHAHLFQALGKEGCRMRDVVHFQFRPWPGGAWLDSLIARTQLRPMFHYRHKVLRREFGEWRPPEQPERPETV